MFPFSTLTVPTSFIPLHRSGLQTGEQWSKLVQFPREWNAKSVDEAIALLCTLLSPTTPLLKPVTFTYIYIYTSIRTYIHSFIHAHIHTFIHTRIYIMNTSKSV